MKINTVDTVIQDWREGQNIFRRPSVELLVREISRLQAQVTLLEGSQTQEYLVPPESFEEFINFLKQGKEDGKVIVKNVTVNNAYRKQLENDGLRSILKVILDHVDYTNGACRLNEMIGAVLPVQIINLAKERLRDGEE